MGSTFTDYTVYHTLELWVTVTLMHPHMHAPTHTLSLCASAHTNLRQNQTGTVTNHGTDTLTNTVQ